MNDPMCSSAKSKDNELCRECEFKSLCWDYENVSKFSLKIFDNMRNCLEWINEHHPEILKEYNEQNKVD